MGKVKAKKSETSVKTTSAHEPRPRAVVAYTL